MIAEKEFGSPAEEMGDHRHDRHGLGSGVMLDGKILRDPHLQFGTQASHIVPRPPGPALPDGARGTAEMLCSATALAQQVRDGLARGIPSVLSERNRRASTSRRSWRASRSATASASTSSPTGRRTSAGSSSRRSTPTRRRS
jgi:hypothetical protein